MATPAAPASGRLPVTVVTGFLGAGKTTLLRHLLLQSGQRLAVLVNEFGEVGIDGDLLRGCGFCADDELEGRVVELANGCLCCTVQEEFLPTMQRLLQRAADLDGIVVETSGLALPEPLLAAFRWPEIRACTWVNGVVTVVDGEALAGGSVVTDPAALEAQRRDDPSLDHASAIADLFAEQLACADLVLVSRADRLDGCAFESLRQGLQPRLRPGTAVLPMARGAIDPELVLGWRGAPAKTAAATSPQSHVHDQEDDHGPDHDHAHDDHEHTHVAMESIALRLDGSVDRQGLEAALPSLIRSHGLLRVKGRLWLPGKARPLELQAVGPRLESWFAARIGESSAEPGLDLVVMGFALDAGALQAALQPLVFNP